MLLLQSHLCLAWPGLCSSWSSSSRRAAVIAAPVAVAGATITGATAIGAIGVPATVAIIARGTVAEATVVIATVEGTTLTALGAAIARAIAGAIVFGAIVTAVGVAATGVTVVGATVSAVTVTGIGATETRATVTGAMVFGTTITGAAVGAVAAAVAGAPVAGGLELFCLPCLQLSEQHLPLPTFAYHQSLPGRSFLLLLVVRLLLYLGLLVRGQRNDVSGLVQLSMRVAEFLQTGFGQKRLARARMTHVVPAHVIATLPRSCLDRGNDDVQRV